MPLTTMRRCWNRAMQNVRFLTRQPLFSWLACKFWQALNTSKTSRILRVVVSYIKVSYFSLFFREVKSARGPCIFWSAFWNSFQRGNRLLLCVARCCRGQVFNVALGDRSVVVNKLTRIVPTQRWVALNNVEKLFIFLYCFVTPPSISLSGKSFFSLTTTWAGFSVNFSFRQCNTARFGRTASLFR